MSEFNGWDRASLIRQWWYEYARVLRRSPGLGDHDGLKQIEDALGRRGWLPKGGPMPRDGAEDLARDCDLLRGRV